MPRISEPKERKTEQPTMEQKPARPVQVIERRVETAIVEIPVGEPPREFREVHIEGWLRGTPAHTFARIRQALRDTGAKMSNGKQVVSNADVMRWMMEQIG